MERLRIGEWWADPATNELGRGGDTVRLEPKAMQVLVFLAARPGRVVSREELFSAVWPGVVVGDEALTQSIIKLRRALGDNPRDPAYIETISKRGYRLIAAVGQGSVSTRRRLPVIAASVALALLAALAYVFHKPPADAPAEAELLTVTVAPFESLGDDYLARGISNDLMTDLSRLPGVRVIRGAGSARYVVSGTVQRASDTLRLTVYLVDSETKQQLWSERYERAFGDLFAVQDEMIARLTQVLPGKLARAARERRAKRYTRSLEAYDNFLRAQARFLVRQAGANDEARELYKKALELDPKFARAYAGLAMTYAMDYRLRGAGDAAPALARALELAETARSIDPDIPEVHWALGFVHVQSRRHEQGIQSLQKAIELDRSFADAYAFMGGIYTYLGQPAKSIPLLRTAMRLNPDGGYLYFLLLGRAYLFENDVEQALINLREASARNPADVETHIYLAAAMAAAGDRFAAGWEADQIRALEAGFSPRVWLETYPLTSTRHKERLVELLAQAGL